MLRNTMKNISEGSVSIVVRNYNSEVAVSVQDTGVGIDPELFPRLFSKFAIRSSTGGTALGSFISKSTIEAHRGKIWALNPSNGIKPRRGSSPMRPTIFSKLN